MDHRIATRINGSEILDSDRRIGDSRLGSTDRRIAIRIDGSGGRGREGVGEITCCLLPVLPLPVEAILDRVFLSSSGLSHFSLSFSHQSYNASD